MEFASLSHKGQGERECLHVFNATKHAHVTESANLLLERIWSVEDQDLLMVFEIQVVGIVLWILQGVNGHVAVTLRYRVDRFTLNCAAMSCTGTSFARSSVRMVFSSLGLSFFGRPPLRPRARAALRPASVRSRIKLRSNSAKAAKT